MSQPQLTATVAAHQLVLERLLARALDPEALGRLEADCLAVEDGLYSSVVRRKGDHEEVQRMLSALELLFAGARQAQQMR